MSNADLIARARQLALVAENAVDQEAFRDLADALERAENARLLARSEALLPGEVSAALLRLRDGTKDVSLHTRLEIASTLERASSAQDARREALEEVVRIFLWHHAATKDQADFGNEILKAVRALIESARQESGRPGPCGGEVGPLPAPADQSVFSERTCGNPQSDSAAAPGRLSNQQAREDVQLYIRNGGSPSIGALALRGLDGPSEARERLASEKAANEQYAKHTRELLDEREQLTKRIKELKAQLKTAYGYGSDAGKPPWMKP